MNKQEILGFLDQLKKLSEEIGRSQKHGQPLPADTTRKWEQRLRFLVEHLREELGLVSAGTSGAESTGTLEAEHNDLR